MEAVRRRIALHRGLLLPAIVLLTMAPTSGGCQHVAEPGTDDLPPGTSSSVSHYTYEVINAYPHDATAFTQGLAFDDGLLYEGTGRKGESSLRKVQLETGAVMQSISLPDDYFGEGITICGDRIVQLTWRSGIGFVYDSNDLRLLDSFTYDTEGWGITHDGERLIMSDGTARLYFLNPDTHLVEYYVTVYDRGAAVSRLNELEFINGLVYANVWQTDTIAMINPADGRVTGWLDLSGLLDTRPISGQIDVLNGIAYDAAGDRLFVTGKLWPWLFEIRMLQK